jgi:hypothetical protein
MPPVFGRGGKRNGYSAVAEGEERDLGSLQELLDHHRVPERRERLERAIDLLLRPTDVDTLPRRETVRLHDAGGPGKGESSGSRDTSRSHHLLRERLRPLDRGCRAPGPEDGDPPVPEEVGDAGHERRLGADDDEIHVERAGEREHVLRVVGSDGVTRRMPGDPRVPGRRV